MNKSLLILTIALLACGVDAHETTDSSDRLHQLLTEDRCSYCDDYRAQDAEQQRKIQRQLNRIERRQRWDRMQDSMDRANRR